MRVEQRDGYRVVVGGPVPPQADAITFGRTVVVRKSAASHDGLMAHEVVHVRQFIELGPLRFLVRYVGSYLRFRLNGYGHMASYRRIPLEVEASWASRVHRLGELEQQARDMQQRSVTERRQQSRRSSPQLARPSQAWRGQPATTGTLLDRNENRASGQHSRT